MASTINGSDDFDTAYALQHDVTILDDNSGARVYNGTITLSEALTNFDEIIFICGNSSASFLKEHRMSTDLMIVGKVYEVFSTGAGDYARWTYTNSTTLTFNVEFNSWIYKIYGRSRK